jgi:hypothetical protein
MNDYAIALLDAYYGPLLAKANEQVNEQAEEGAEDEELSEGAAPAILPKADIFNAVVNWLRTDSGMEPLQKEKSGIAELINQREAGRKR